MERGIEALVKKGIFSEVDFYFAKTLVFKEENALCILLSFLFAAARSGHLCIYIREQGIFPHPGFLTKDPEEVSFLQEQIREAFLQVPASFCSRIEDPSLPIKTPLCLYKEALYLQKNWYLERDFLFHLRRLQAQELPVLTKVACRNLLLNQEQLLGIERMLTSPISLLSGGPGTGKTFTAIEGICVFLESFSEKERLNLVIKLAAPTGKAAALLEKKVVEKLGHVPGLSCGTIHSFLQGERSLCADLFILDEASMLDAKLFVRFLSVLQGGRVLLMGDKDQLPPVEIGGFFSSSILLAEKLSLPVTLLFQGLRTANVHLQTLAKAVLQGDLFSLCKMSSVRCFSDKETAVIQEYVVEECLKLFAFLTRDLVETLLGRIEALHKIEQFCVLSGLKKGPLGSIHLNTLIQKRLLQSQKEASKVICPILITANDQETGLVNGEVGLLVAKASSWRTGYFTADDKAFFLSKQKTGLIEELAAATLPVFSLGYCLSIHKSQGSEYTKVLLLLPSGSERLGKEVLYTGVTRAKEEVILLAEEETLKRLLQTSSHKVSGLELHSN